MVAARNLRAISSATVPTREHFGEIARGQKSPLSVDFNGVLPAGVALTGATWRCWSPWALAMSDAKFSGRASEVTIAGGWGCDVALRCTATASDGSIHVQEFVIHVAQRRWFQGEPTQSAGPQTIEAVPA